MAQGTLCIAALTRIGIVETSIQGARLYEVSPTLAAFAPGTVVRTQLWFRDVGSWNRTDALELEVVH